MASAHYICHAVSLAIIAALIHNYISLKVESERLCGTSVPAPDTDGHIPTETRERLDVDSQSRPSLPRVQIFSSEYGDLVNSGSSVWCSSSKQYDRICLFHNLCYLPSQGEFLFFHSDNSVMENLPHPSSGEIESSMLDLSSVADHNAHYFNLVHVPSEAAKIFSSQWILKKSLAFRRFKPDNLMHVLHDDILPLHHTLGMISSISNLTDKYNVQIVCLGDWDSSLYLYHELYQSLSLYKPLHKEDLDAFNRLTCFKEIYVGISKSTVWYQYGFSQPQGPVPGSRVTAQEIHRTADFIRNQMPKQETSGTSYDGRYLLLLSRKETRLLLNEEELSSSIAAEFKVKIIHVSTETSRLRDMIHLTTNSIGLIGMHGALMSLTMFLKPGSIVVELFPYAINPDNYTPYRTLANLQGMGLVYRAWKNNEAGNSSTHPDWPPDLGGIIHLPADTQYAIQSQTDVPLHLCCDNPAWLYRIYQDTIVNIADVLELISDSFNDVERLDHPSGHISGRYKSQTLSPSNVEHLHCVLTLTVEGEQFLHVTWQEPWNVQFLIFTKLHYELLVQEQNQEDHVKYLLGKPEYSLPILEDGGVYFIWVRAVLDDIQAGHFINKMDCYT